MRHDIPALKKRIEARVTLDNRVRSFITPQRIVYQAGGIRNGQVLLENRAAQQSLGSETHCEFPAKASILLDYGFEFHGGIGISISGTSEPTQRTVRLRIRFGESAQEAMSDVDASSATNDHAVRDQVVEVSSFYGYAEIGLSGFRFVRIDSLEENVALHIKSIQGIFLYEDLEYRGSFCCDDPLLNRIWEVGAYTVHLNIQNYIWDGIKRDRLVWIGDIHPEASTVLSVFGQNPCIPNSLDFIRDTTPADQWMNGIPAYSMWWLLIHKQWYLHTGDLAYLQDQRTYMKQMAEHIGSFVRDDGEDTIPHYFLDWPSSGDPIACKIGVRALLVMALEAAEGMLKALGEVETAQKCQRWAQRVRSREVKTYGNKQSAALLALAGMADPQAINRSCLQGVQDVSTFFGFYIVKAKALAGDMEGALDLVRRFWGGMLSLGATTFWEDFDVCWLENAARIDELTPEGKVDIHAAYGQYCYSGYRHSLCHGWASGPTPWMSQYVLGVQVLEPGCRKVAIRPQLGDLQWVEGAYPTPYGNIWIRHEKNEDGSLRSAINAPHEVEIVGENA